MKPSNDADVSIVMNKKDVALLSREMSAWLAGDEGSDDYGTMPEINFSHISHEDNHLSKEEYKKVLEERARTFGWTEGNGVRIISVINLERIKNVKK